MRRILAVLMIVALVGIVAVPSADAGGRHRHGGSAVIGLAAFALFAPLIIAGEVLAATIPYRAPAVAAAPPPYYAPAPAYYSPAPPPAYVEQVTVAPARASAPAMSRVVQHPHGRYVLRGDGVHTAYQWVWIPNPPPPPPPPR
jgi:hypothetical protein